jgi:hypothetical protein
MPGQRRQRLASLFLMGILAAGCGPVPAIYVETTIHPDGSCDRMIWQPKHKFLPDQALKPEWNACWKTVSDASGRPGMGDSKVSYYQRKYFIARGSFSSPREIPPHYHFADDEVPDAGASELERTYERKDFGFVVEHRWREKITNIVTFAGYLRARDELLDLFLPLSTEAIEKIFGQDYDVSRLVNHIRADGRRLVENVSVIIYDAAVRRRILGEDGKLDGDLAMQMLDEAKRFGLDRELLEAFKVPANEKEGMRNLNAFLGRLIVQYFRHRDGSEVTAAEADELIQAVSNHHRYENAIQEQNKRIEDLLKGDKELEKRLRLAFLRMSGLYVPWKFLFEGGPPEYEFAIQLPGELVETSGTGTKAGRTRWKFTGVGLFPGGYEMKARSILIDRDAQKKVLGRVAIDDETKAVEFIETVGREGPLLEAVREVRQTGDRSALSQLKSDTYEERLRATKVRSMLFGEKATFIK